MTESGLVNQPDAGCTCGVEPGECSSPEHPGVTRITWSDSEGKLHVNAAGALWSGDV